MSLEQKQIVSKNDFYLLLLHKFRFKAILALFLIFREKKSFHKRKIS